MTQKLYEAIQDLLSTHSSSQLIPYENFLREAAKLHENYGMIERDFDPIFEEIAIARAENDAYMNGVAEGDEPYFQMDDIPDDAYMYDEIDLPF